MLKFFVVALIVLALALAYIVYEDLNCDPCDPIPPMTTCGEGTESKDVTNEAGEVTGSICVVAAVNPDAMVNTGPEYHIVYEFNIPGPNDECPVGTHYETVPDGDVVDPMDGGGGVVDRDGGGGVVDRQGKFVDQWCEVDCDAGEPSGQPVMQWNYYPFDDEGPRFIVAKKTCS